MDTTENDTLQFRLLVQFNSMGKLPKEHVEILVSSDEMYLNGQSIDVKYNGIQLRFEPVDQMFTRPVLASNAICFDGMDPEYPEISDVYDKIAAAFVG